MPTSQGRTFRKKYKGEPSGPWWIAYYVDGVEYRESSGSKRKKDAIALKAKRLQKADEGSWSPPSKGTTVAELLDLVLDDYQNNNKSLQWVQYVDQHLRPFFGKLPANKVVVPRSTPT